MSFFKTPHICCFFVLRCLIYKVHAPTAEHVIDYHVARELSTPFLHFFGFSQKYFGDKPGKRCSVTCSRVVHDRDFHCLQIQPWLRAASPKGRAPHRGQRQAGAGAPPTGAGTSAFSPDTTPLMDYTGMDLMNGSIFDQAAAGCLFSFCLKFPVISQSVESVLCGTAGSSGHPGSFAYSRRKNLAPMFMEADRSQL